MNKKKGVLSLITTAVLIAVLGFTVLVGFGKDGTGAMKNIKLGLDLAGGVSITCQVKDENPTCLLYTSPSPRDGLLSRMPSSA